MASTLTNNYSFKTDAATIEKMADYYRDFQIDPVAHARFRAKKIQVTITAYHSGTVLFQGNGAMKEAARWQMPTTPTGSQPSIPITSTGPGLNHLHVSERLSSLEDLNLIGSDEVGNGSYFGSLTVCALYLPKPAWNKLRLLGVRDSKQLTDTKIRQLAPYIQEAAKYHLIDCQPQDYNRLIGPYNAISIKVYLHNQALQALFKSLSVQEQAQLDGAFIDQFTSPSNYNNYLANIPHAFPKKIYFEKRAESLYLSVACASILARQAFLTSLESLGKPMNLVLPSGAGPQVDAVGRRLVKTYGSKVLNTIAKRHFKNTDRIISQEKK